MYFHYDDVIDALFLSFCSNDPNGVIEIQEGINIDTTADGKIAGIEILQASQNMDIGTILTYSLELEPDAFKRQAM